MECKAGGLSGPARIGRARFSRTLRTFYYGDQQLRRLRGGYKANHYDVAIGEEYWVSGPRKDGADRLYGERLPVHVDEDVRAEYWTQIRGLPHRAHEADANR